MPENPPGEKAPGQLKGLIELHDASKKSIPFKIVLDLISKHLYT